MEFYTALIHARFFRSTEYSTDAIRSRADGRRHADENERQHYFRRADREEHLARLWNNRMWDLIPKITMSHGN